MVSLSSPPFPPSPEIRFPFLYLCFFFFVHVPVTILLPCAFLFHGPTLVLISYQSFSCVNAASSFTFFALLHFSQSRFLTCKFPSPGPFVHSWIFSRTPFSDVFLRLEFRPRPHLFIRNVFIRATRSLLAPLLDGPLMPVYSGFDSFPSHWSVERLGSFALFNLPPFQFMITLPCLLILRLPDCRCTLVNLLTRVEAPSSPPICCDGFTPVYVPGFRQKTF